MGRGGTGQRLQGPGTITPWACVTAAKLATIANKTNRRVSGFRISKLSKTGF
jgi:hypothetical protein